MTKNARRTFFIRTFGCQMNRDDSAEMARLLLGLGMTEARSASDADLLHINTCCVRQKAEDKFFSYLGQYREMKERTGVPVIGVSGCVPGRINLAEKLPFLDYVTGSENPYDYIHLISEVVNSKFPELSGSASAGGASVPFAYHTVIRGCSNYCTYCVVPYVRGPEKSIPPENIAEAVRAKIDSGAREITLLGQNVLAYGLDLEPKRRLIDAIALIHDITGLDRIRFVTSHPAWVNEEFIRGLKNFPKVCEHYHVPFQSGDDEVLDRMNRGYTAAEYIDMVRMIREYFPAAGITADAIVGFSGETPAQFENTLRLIEQVKIDNIYAFKYSVRPGTQADSAPDDIPDAEKKRRLAALNDLQDVISREINNSLVGSEQEVMVEEVVENGARYRGRTRSNKVTDFRASRDLNPGDVAMARITAATPHGVQGESRA